MNRKAADDLRAWMLLVPAITRWLPRAMENKWYVDEIYHATIRFPLWIAGTPSTSSIGYLVDGIIVNTFAKLPRFAGELFRPLQNGALQSYAVSMAGGSPSSSRGSSGSGTGRPRMSLWILLLLHPW